MASETNTKSIVLNVKTETVSEKKDEEQKTQQVAHEAAAELDLAFCCDCTGSMSSYLRAAQDNILRIAKDIDARCSGKCDLRYALVKYRDHPPQDRSFVTEVFPFNPSVVKMKAAVDTMKAAGGGDGPEAVAAALHAVNELQWRPNSTKVVVLISDAPPHGLGETGDGFPNGCPDGHDPIATCRVMAAKGIVVYAVGVEPILSTQYKFARDFMMAVAKTTDGKFLPLGQAAILSDVIVAGAVEGLEMEALWGDLEAKVAKEAAAAGETLKREDLVDRVACRVEAKQKEVVMQAVEVSNPYMEAYDESNVDALCGATSLKGVNFDHKANAKVAQQAAGFEWHKQEAFCAPSAMTTSQASRMRSKKGKGI